MRKIFAVSVLSLSFFVFSFSEDFSLSSLIPQDGWDLTEELLYYYPESLFEYINGAAEAYLSYDFKELLVSQLKSTEEDATISVEIYDMGSIKNAFGIYSAERYPDNRFIPLGIQGYIEEGLLNLLAGSYYIKIICYDCGEESEKHLLKMGKGILNNIPDIGRRPELLDILDIEGLQDNSEKFVLNNFMGYSFFHNGYSAQYRVKRDEFSCFLIEAKDDKEAQMMFRQFCVAKGIKSDASRVQYNDPYYHHFFIAQEGRYLCGVKDINDGFESIGEIYLTKLIDAVMKKKDL